MKAFSADWICPVSGPPVREGCLLVDGGRVAEVVGAAPAGIPHESFPGSVLLPGLVNTHTHLELTLLRGFLENVPFPAWIRRLTRTKYELMDREDLLLSARLGVLECLGAGVTTVGEVMDAGTGLEAMAEAGLRGIAYQEVFGPAEDAADGALRDMERKLESARPLEDETRRVGVSPHAPYTVSERLFRSVGDWARNRDLALAVHVGESREEGRFVREADGPFAEAWRSRGMTPVPRGIGPLTYLDQLSLVGARTLLIHAIDVEPSEIRMIRDRGASIAHCPKSNLKLGHGMAPVREYREAGVPVGLGTDSVASNNVVDMFEEMRAAVFLQRVRAGDAAAPKAADALRMATLDGARCLGLEDRVGSLEAGKLADFLVVELSDAARTPVYDPVEALVYTANRDCVRATYLGGERVHREESQILAQARARARALQELGG